MSGPEASSEHVVDLPQALVKEAAVVMAQAFCTSPTYVSIFRGDEAFRLEVLTWLFEVNLEMVLNKDPHAAKCVIEDGHVIAAFILVTHAARLTELDWLTSRLVLVPFYYGWAAMRRLLATMFFFEGTVRTVFERGVPAFALERLVVRPDRQGQGIGTACLAAALNRVREEGCVLRLATQEARNVRLYRRVGFEVLGQKKRVEDDPQFSYTSWFMECNPRDVDASADN